jgi:hypothetical protein
VQQYTAGARQRGIDERRRVAGGVCPAIAAIGMGERRAKSSYVRMPAPLMAVCSSTRWQARQFMDSCEKGPVIEMPAALSVSAMTGSPCSRWALTSCGAWTAKNCAKRDSVNNRFPSETSGGSMLANGAGPRPPEARRVAAAAPAQSDCREEDGEGPSAEPDALA